MSRIRQAFVVAVLASAGLAGAEEPPYKRLLQGDDARKAAALQKRVYDLWAARKFAEAVAPAEELLALRKGVQGEGHWEAADAARWVRTLRQAAALPADKQASLAETYGLMRKANALQWHGKYAEAELLFRQELAIEEEVLGRKHPHTASTCNALAVNQQAQGRYKGAEPLFRRALAAFEEVLGPRHPDTAGSYNNLAVNLRAQGRAKEAEPLFRQALAN
jgi:tetratricopeptide (TPR) repeat protein